MNEQEKQKYLEEYKKDKEKGVFFFPDIIFKDAVVSLIVFAILVGLAFFLGAPLEERANPSDANYNPRPEWYFLFLFQLLKYFPGELEVIGVVVIPTLVILLLLGLPFLDKRADRYYSKRKVVIISTAIGMLGIILLTTLSILETPPPAQIGAGDKTAELYIQNCSGCHGPAINVPVGMDLHTIIAQGTHEGMPPWSADLTNDQIDALVGFILSPAGSSVFERVCGECHQSTDLVGVSPLDLKDALQSGPEFVPHNSLEIPKWANLLDAKEQSALLNFLIAPDGHRLFVTNCASCHGSSVSYSGTEENLYTTISEGGLHLEMPAWRDKLNEQDLTTLINYVVNPSQTPEGEALYQANCTVCHFDRVPLADSVEATAEIISQGGSHETMPVWGEILTTEQIAALTAYTLESSLGSGTEVGRQLFVENCAACHGDFGEGGPNPSLAGDVIAPISTSEYLSTRDDITLKSIISLGQPNFGMSPFGLSYGGPLGESEIDALVSYMRSWEEDPPVDLPPEIPEDIVALSGPETFQRLCTQCHGVNLEGGLGPSLRTPEFQEENSREDIFNSINLGHPATPMIAWGQILTAAQIDQVVDFILSLPADEGSAAGEVSFSAAVKPAFDTYCVACHNESYAAGGWIASTYDDVINSGETGQVVLPGDPENSILAQKILGTQQAGNIMPPSQPLPEEIVQLILDWIIAGAPNN